MMYACSQPLIDGTDLPPAPDVTTGSGHIIDKAVQSTLLALGLRRRHLIAFRVGGFIIVGRKILEIPYL